MKHFVLPSVLGLTAALTVSADVSATASVGRPPPDLDAFFEEDAVEMQVSRQVPGSEDSSGSDADSGPADHFAERSNSGRQGSNPDQSDHAGSTRGNDNEDAAAPAESSSSLYCSAGAGVLDPACQSIVGTLPDSLGCVSGANLGVGLSGSTSPVCVDETPEPVEDEEVLEAAVEEPEDAEPDIDLIIQQIPGEVAEEFATLPIDGGSVAFEEELQGFGFINRHTNVFADVEDQTFERDMLGIDVEIRAVPVDYHFDYGDGTVRSAADPGSSAAGSASALTDVETPTSHVYQETGLYDVGLTATFTGEYRIAGGAWTPIADSTTVEASPGQADIWRTQARHVSGQCEDPGQWGCNGPFTIDGDDRPPDVFADQYDDAGNWHGP